MCLKYPIFLKEWTLLDLAGRGYGAATKSRTRDLLITSQLLYHG